MEIKAAIKIAREGADHMDDRAKSLKFMFETRLSNVYAVQAAAIYTVCDKLEALLAEQEEDNSYHSR